MRFLVILLQLCPRRACVLFVLTLASTMVSGPRGDNPEGPVPGPQTPMSSHSIDEVLRRLNAEYLTVPGVEGTGRTQTQSGVSALQVWVRHASVAESIPSTFEGYPVIVEVVPGGFHAH